MAKYIIMQTTHTMPYDTFCW